jgi:hypothetical protein
LLSNPKNKRPLTKEDFMKTTSTFKKIMILTMIGTATINMMPRKSHAIVGAATGAVPLLIIGGGMVGSAAVITFLGDPDLPAIVYSFLGAIAGLIILDDHNQVSPHYSALNAQSAVAINIDPANELNAYNNSLSAINAINQTIVSETMAYNQPSTTTTELSTFVAQKWATYGQLLSPEAQSALKKVQASVVANANHAARAN